MKRRSGIRLSGWVCCWLAGGLLAVSNGRACEDTTVRDAAFNEPRDVHTLAVMGRKDDPSVERIRLELAHWLVESGTGLNLEVVSVDVEDPETRWERFGIPSAPPSSPVVVLVGHSESERRNFFVDHWEPAPTGGDLKLLERSPVRDSLVEKLGTHLAVILYAPGANSEGNKTPEVLKSVSDQWNSRADLEVSVLEIDRTDPRERVLVAFLGIPPEGPDWIAVCFGKGKVTPPLEGGEITETALNGLIASLAAECTCIQTASRFGVDLPLKWLDSRLETVVRLKSAGSPEAEDRIIAGLDVYRLLGPTLLVFGGLAAVVMVAGIRILRRRTETV